jgi:peptidoglycan hydrolase-like protein with peptidoglycan-binding domain
MPDFGAASSDQVKAAQHYLNANNYASPPLAEDGSAGPLTQAATRRFQATMGLTQDGLIGPQTLGAMGIKSLPTTTLTTVNGPVIPGLRQAVVNAFPDFSGKFEGKALPYPYTDSKGYVTTGTGNKMDPVSVMLAQPWRHGVGGPLATQAEVQAGFQTLKDAWPGVQSTACQSLTDLRLNPEDLNKLLFGTLKNNHNYLSAHIPGYTDHPADAQLAYHSLAWAWGPGFARVWGPNGDAFLAAVGKGDFSTASDIVSTASNHEQSINPGIVPRIAATRALLDNADKVAKSKRDPDTLYWPGDVAEVAAQVAQAATLTWGAIGLSILSGMAVWKKIKTGTWGL